MAIELKIKRTDLMELYEGIEATLEPVLSEGVEATFELNVKEATYEPDVKELYEGVEATFEPDVKKLFEGVQATIEPDVMDEAVISLVEAITDTQEPKSRKPNKGIVYGCQVT